MSPIDAQGKYYEDDRGAALMQKIAAQEVEKARDPNSLKDVLDAEAAKFAEPRGEGAEARAGVSPEMAKLLQRDFKITPQEINAKMDKFNKDVLGIRSDDPDVQAAAFKVAVYNNFAPRDVSQAAIPEILADYTEKYAEQKGVKYVDSSRVVAADRDIAATHTVKEIKHKDLAKNIKTIAGVVINKNNEKEVEALKDVSGKIAQASIDRANSKDSKGWSTSEVGTSFKDKIKGAWKSFTQKLENLTAVGKEKNRVRDSIKNFVLGKSQDMKHRDTPTPPVGGGVKAAGQDKGRG